MEDHNDQPNPAELDAQLSHDAEPVARFEQLIAEVEQIGQLPYTQHGQVYERAHQQLAESLDQIARS